VIVTKSIAKCRKQQHTLGTTSSPFNAFLPFSTNAVIIS